MNYECQAPCEHLPYHSEIHYAQIQPLDRRKGGMRKFWKFHRIWVIAPLQAASAPDCCKTVGTCFPSGISDAGMASFLRCETTDYEYDSACH